MGYYIQCKENLNKAQQLITDHGAVVSVVNQENPIWYDIPENHALICVVQNGLFDAAALCYNESEMNKFNDSLDTRPKTWLIMDKALAHELAGYTESLDPIRDLDPPT